MSASNGVHLLGRITRDPELRETQNGTAVCAFGIAVQRSYKSADGTYASDFIDCVAWRNSAEFIAKYFHKGAMIALDGELQTRNYTDKDGNKRKAVEVLVSGAAFTGEKIEKADTRAAEPSAMKAAEEYIMNDEDLPF